jgi:hypothetical protein
MSNNKYRKITLIFKDCGLLSVKSLKSNFTIIASAFLRLFTIK